MNCPKCGAGKMQWNRPVYFNRENNEGGFLYDGESYHCRICGKVVFLHRDIGFPEKRFIHGQVCNGTWEESW